jgi:hypothetical protein
MPWFFIALLVFIGAVALYKVLEILGSVLASIIAVGLVLLAIPVSLVLSVFVAYWVLRAIGATLFSSDNTIEEDPYHYMNYGDLYDADDKRANEWRDD